MSTRLRASAGFLIACFLALFAAAPSFAQFTLVSGTVTDSNNLAYACATISAQIVNTNGQTLYLNGQIFSSQPSATKLGCPTDPSTSRTPGAYTVSLADNTQIKCGNAAGQIVACGTQTTWNFTVNSTGTPPPLGTGPQTCQLIGQTISGSSQTLNLTGCPALSNSSAGGITQGRVPQGVVDPTVSPYNALFDVHRVKDASTTLSSGTVTCPNSDCNFTGTDLLGRPIAKVNQYCFGTTGGVIAGSLDIAGKISAINGANSITCTGLALSNTSGAVIFAWGDDDSTAINNAWNAAANVAAANGSDVAFQIPAGMAFTNACLWNTVSYPNNGSYDAYQTPVIQGVGRGASIIIPLPLTTQTISNVNGTFNLSTCPTGDANYPPMFGPAGTNASTSVIMRDFTIDGLGNGLNGINMGNLSILGSGDVAAPIGLNRLDDVTVVGFGSKATNLYGLRTGGTQSYYRLTFVDGGGTGVLIPQPGNASGAGPFIDFENVFFGDCGSVCVNTPGGGNLMIINSFGSMYGPNGAGGANATISMGAGTIFNSYGDSLIDQGATVGVQLNGGVGNFNGDYWSRAGTASGVAVQTVNGGKAFAQNTVFKGGSGGDSYLGSSASDLFFDLGGNTFTGTFSTSGQVRGAVSTNSVTVTAAKLVLSANWGTGAAVSALSGGDAPIQFTITNGSASTGASPTITYTFPTPYYASPFSCNATQTGGTNATGTFTSSALSATGVTFTFSLTPTASDTEIVYVTCVTP